MTDHPSALRIVYGDEGRPSKIALLIGADEFTKVRHAIYGERDPGGDDAFDRKLEFIRSGQIPDHWATGTNAN